MSEWNRGDAEMAIALKRAELNRVLQHKGKYDAEGHNLCLALIRFKDGTMDALTAYSNDSAISQSIRLGLNLIPDTYSGLAKDERFGCDGMAQYHTEPKLLNYICATPMVRQGNLHGSLPRHSFYKSVLAAQREQAGQQAHLLKTPAEIASLTLVTEIDCCATCRTHSVSRFRAKFPKTALHAIELGKNVREKVPTQFKEVKIKHS